MDAIKEFSTNKPEIIVLVGLPASGKSTWANIYVENRENTILLSSDKIREELFGDEATQGDPKKVFALLETRLIKNIKEGKNVVVDATSINRWERKNYIEIAKDFNAIPVAVIFDTPVEECKRRNQGRERVVPDFVYDKMLKKYEAPSIAEGFVMVLREKVKMEE